MGVHQHQGHLGGTLDLGRVQECAVRTLERFQAHVALRHPLSRLAQEPKALGVELPVGIRSLEQGIRLAPVVPGIRVGCHRQAECRCLSHLDRTWFVRPPGTPGQRSGQDTSTVDHWIWGTLVGRGASHRWGWIAVWGFTFGGG